ncbi:DUF222 domain-containing protein [Rhodococcus sp. NPDC057297]|uniref:HNH endonuclease signature motif containing protein n=1 Tax=Rhodococcus sp. NPDC057297 TaxID=3346090 RepID=UPI003644ABC0
MPRTAPRSTFARCAGPQPQPTIDPTLLTQLADAAREENQACARKIALAAQIWDSCINQTVQIGDFITDAGNYAASETAATLGCSKTVADTLAEIGMDLRLRLPAIAAAFADGDIDVARIRAIYRTTAGLTADAAHRIETETLTAARHLSPGPLATEINAIITRTAPDEAAANRKDVTDKLTSLRYRDKDLIATLEANLPAAQAAACWQLITEMAATLCPRDPRTRSQRLAAAFVTLIHRDTHLTCTCTPDDDKPCTANPQLPDRRTPLTSITIDVDTLLGLRDLPAYLAGHGIIDPEYARELAANSHFNIILTDATNLADRTGITTAPAQPRPTHISFNPLGRGRRRSGLALPTPSTPPTPTPRQCNENYSGTYQLIDALEAAIKTNPALAVPLYPDGHGGLTTPPPGALTYRPGTALADLVRHRDRTCRHPGCDVPAAGCEIDHIIAFDHHNPTRGGWTILTNLHCLCRYHHSLKTMGAWTPTMLAGAAEYWKSTSGTTAVTLPGNTTGRTDLAPSSLLPHIPKKRRQPHHRTDKPESDPDNTTAPPSYAEDTDDPAPF